MSTGEPPRAAGNLKAERLDADGGGRHDRAQLPATKPDCSGVESLRLHELNYLPQTGWIYWCINGILKLSLSFGIPLSNHFLRLRLLLGVSGHLAVNFSHSCICFDSLLVNVD